MAKSELHIAMKGKTATNAGSQAVIQKRQFNGSLQNVYKVRKAVA
jgi:hypothetical protein